MKLIDCPHIGARSASEFVYGGEVRRPPLQQDVSDKVWAEYVYNRDNSPGVKREWWCHSPSGMWFVFERDTLADEFIKLVDMKEVQYEL